MFPKIKKKAVIFTINTSGYGSPHFLYLASMLQQKNYDVVLYEPFENSRPFYHIEGFKRVILKNKIHELISITKLFIASLFRPYLLITGVEKTLFALFRKRNIMVMYYYEILDDYYKPNESYSFVKLIKSHLIKKFRDNIKYVLAPQEDRLRLARNIYKNARGKIVLNTPLLRTYEVKAKDRTPKIKVLYQGQINDLSQGEKLIEIFERANGFCEFHVAGFISDKYKAKIHELVSGNIISYYGLLKSKELIPIREKCHVGLVTWGNNGETYMYAAPVKLFEYIKDGLVIVSFNNYSIMKWNNEFNFGYVVQNEANDIESVISILYDLSQDFESIYNISGHNIDTHIKYLNYEAQIEQFMNDLSVL